MGCIVRSSDYRAKKRGSNTCGGAGLKASGVLWIDYKSTSFRPLSTGDSLPGLSLPLLGDTRASGLKGFRSVSVTKLPDVIT